MKSQNTNYQVYILVSRSRADWIKVGKSNNSRRVPALQKMGYGGISDWELAKSIPVESNEAAFAIESMAHAKLTNEGYRVPRFSWTNLNNSRLSFADECFNCKAEHAVSVVECMVLVYKQYIA